MSKRRFERGDPVVYRVSKISNRPGPRAHDVDPAPRGEHYLYEVDKFWVVAELLDGDRLRLLTRRGKEHVVNVDDPRLRRPNWWERLWWGKKFPRLDEIAAIEAQHPPKQRS